MSKFHSSAVSKRVLICEEDLGFAAGIVPDPRPDRIIESFELRRDETFAGAPFSWNHHHYHQLDTRNFVIGQLNVRAYLFTVNRAPIKSDAMGSSIRISFNWALYSPSRFSTSMTRSKRRASSNEQFSWICDKIVTTCVMGASKGNAFSLAKLVRRRQSEPTDRTSKLPLRIECKEPRGPASFVGTSGIVSLELAFGVSTIKTMCVGRL